MTSHVETCESPQLRASILATVPHAANHDNGAGVQQAHQSGDRKLAVVD